MRAKSQLSMGCGYAVFSILFLGGLGLLALAGAQYDLVAGVPSKNWLVPGIFGALLVIGSLAYLRLAKRLVREGEAEAARRAQHPDKPWLWKQEWTGPAIETKPGAGAAGMWVFALFWNAVSAPGVWVFFHETHRKPAMLLIFLFPLVGLGLLWGAIYQTIRWRKYGGAKFVPSSLPGVIGGYLGGVIEVPARVMPEADARLTLKCIRKEVRGSGKNRSTTENVLWEHEEHIARDKWVSGAGGTSIPVLFYIPAGKPATDDSDRNNEIVWRLAADAATPGVDFAVRFEVPVFATGETVPAPAADAPVLEEYTAVPLDAAALVAGGIRREGDTFHFSASHLPGMRAFTTVALLVIGALFVWYWNHNVPGVVWFIIFFFGAIFSLFAGSVWFSVYELSIEAQDVVVTKPRPWGTKVVRVPREQVKLIKTDKSMASGETQYFRLSLVGAEGVDPGLAAADGEPFRVRKLRYQLAQADKGGNVPPKGEILAEFKVSPKFIVPFAEHVPGQTRAEAVAEMILREIRKH